MVSITLFVKHPHGTLTTIPFVAPPPPVPELAPGERRPVVALFDAAVGHHPWLAPPAVSTTLQLPAGTSAAESDSAESADIEISQHGTFDAGILRRFAPGAAILSVPVMGADGLIEPLDVQQGLTAIRDRVAAADPGSFVDVVCLPLGYVQGRATGEHMAAEKKLLDDLAGYGVLVVAAAGNLSSAEPVFPAAFAAQPPAVGPAVVSVGALNADGCPANYSSYGDWVTHYELGEVDSIVADPPDGYARGEGTSFAATTVAAQLAVALSALGDLTTVTPSATIARARAVLRTLPTRS